jgi:hypothetical protein
MTRDLFLNLNFPIPPYCFAHRSPSTEFNEGFHIKNETTGIQLNIYWRSDNTVSIGSYNFNEKNKFKQFKNILGNKDQFNQEILIDICNKYLKEDGVKC